MAFSSRSVPVAAHTTIKYVMPTLSNNCTGTEERCFLRGPYRDVISRTVSESISEELVGELVR
jgi:hypothetical protein